MSDQQTTADRFRALHQGPDPLLLPNPWDVGSARLFASLGFSALATTSSGYAATLGQPDGALGAEATLRYAARLVAATDLPVSADLENGFAHDPEGVAATVARAADVGLAGCSVEDYTGDPRDPIYDHARATERVRAAVDAAHRGPQRLVLTARAENYLHGNPDLADTVRRLQSYGEAGADVLYAPGLRRLADIRAVVEAVDRPVNVLAVPDAPPVAELADAGVRRISVGGAFAFAAMGAVAKAARELLHQGSYTYTGLARAGQEAMQAVFDQHERPHDAG